MKTTKQQNVQVQKSEVKTLYSTLAKTTLTKEQENYSYIPITNQRKVVSEIF